MKSSFAVVLGSFAMSAFLAGCNGSISKSSSVTTNFSMSGSQDEPGVVAQNNFQKAFDFIIPSAVAIMPPMLLDASNAEVTLNHAWIVVKKIQFKSSETSEAGEENNRSFNYQGPFYVDLLSEEENPFGSVEVPASGLRRVKMLLHKSNEKELPSSAPTALEGNSIYLSGTLSTADGTSDDRNFSYMADDTTDFQVSGPNAVIPEEGKDLMAVIRLGDLIKKIDLSAVTDGMSITSSNRVSASNPCPLIHSQAMDLYTCFRKGLASEAKFGKDEDGDRKLDDSEDNVEE